MWLGRWVGVGSLCVAFLCGCSGSDDPTQSAAGAIACAPLEPVTTSVSLAASVVLAAGQSADGTLYVLSQVEGMLQLFVSADGVLLERPQAGTGEANNGDTHTFLFEYVAETGALVSVQLRQDERAHEI